MRCTSFCKDRNATSFGWAWLAATIALALHLTDEAKHHFLGWYNLAHSKYAGGWAAFGSGKSPAKTRILVLEEHTLLRYGLNAYLNSQPDRRAISKRP